MKKLFFGLTVFGFLFIFSMMISAGTVEMAEYDGTIETTENDGTTNGTETDIIKNQEKAIKIVNKANAKVEQIIDKALLKAETIVTKYENGKISLEDKDVKIEALVVKLQTKAKSITERAMAKATDLGVIVECEWVEVTIDGNVYLVDPIRIVGW